MSSNTLRGIGQGGGDSGDVGAEDDDRAGKPAASDPVEDAKKLAERMPELRKIRSLDSTVPGTRSLDSSVPDGVPSMDPKVPALAATLLGVAAPAVGARSQGTVQGRDVHLPSLGQLPLAHRLAGMRPVAGVMPDERSGGGDTASADANDTPAGTATVRAPTVKINPDSHGHAKANSGLGSHAPWYDDDLATHAGFQDDHPTHVIRKVAIGAAIAAALAVVLFAIVRVNRRSAAMEEAEQRATPTRDMSPTRGTSPPPAAHRIPSSPAAPPTSPANTRPETTERLAESPAAATPVPAAPPSAPAPGVATTPAPPVTPPSAPAAAPRAAAAPAVGLAASAPERGTKSRTSTARQTASVPRGAQVSIPMSVPYPPDTGRPGTPGPGAAMSPAPVPTAPPSNATGEAAAPPARTAGEPSAAPAVPSSPAIKTPSSERRGKPGYDPDSTLPLNIE